MRIIAIVLFRNNQYRSTAARAHIYRDWQSSMGNEEPSEKLIQQRGRGEGRRVQNGMEYREGGWCRDWSEAGTASSQTEGKAFNSLRRLKK